MGSFQFTGGKISAWKSTGIFNYLGNSNMNAVEDSGGDLPNIKNGNVINIYCVYEIQSISSTRSDTFTVQNALFGAMQITKNTDTSKY